MYVTSLFSQETEQRRREKNDTSRNQGAPWRDQAFTFGLFFQKEMVIYKYQNQTRSTLGCGGETPTLKNSSTLYYNTLSMLFLIVNYKTLKTKSNTVIVS